MNLSRLGGNYTPLTDDDTRDQDLGVHQIKVGRAADGDQRPGHDRDVMAEYPSPIPDDSTVRFASMLMISCMRAPFVCASCVSIVVAIVVLPYTGTSCALSTSGFHCFSLMSEMKLG
uniref:Uncharacterized protein n=1 Tax=Anopheles coluzzii TaxID=1518534 RepID=A0A8W7PB62_ANOCL